MKRRSIFIFGPGLANNSCFEPAARDNVNEPMIRLRDRLSDLGIDLATLDERPVEGADQLWFFDVPISSVLGIPLQDRLRRSTRIRRILGRKPLSGRDPLEEALAAGMRDRVYLFIHEPPVVAPANWELTNHAPFARRLTWADGLVDGDRYRKFHFPLPATVSPAGDRPFPDRKLLVTISANKRSKHPLELYTARRASIRSFERSHPDQFDLFGVGWERPDRDGPFRSYRGTVDHKWSVLGNYRFALAYENTREMPGYVTEKIFDCLRAGAVPIYWGAPNIGAYVDPAAFIDRRAFESNEELGRYLSSLGEREFGTFREAARDFLSSGQLHPFLPGGWSETVLNALELSN